MTQSPDQSEQSEQSDRAERSALPENLLALLTDHLGAHAHPENLSAGMTFESLGMDSLSLMELVVAAEEKFAVVLPEDALDLAPSSTLAEAARAFRNARAV
ncbi:acyl carrier protein [Streptomyces morookaense]|uniref:acyl carrier protein n=1 Tax=Streptomyces morookaense TaxID=1970 RepID=UPI00340644A6